MTPIIFSTYLKRFLAVFLLGVFLPLLIGCDGTPEEVSETPIPQIFVVPVSTEKRLISEEQIPLNNCDGNFEITQTIERKHTILYTLQLENGVSVNVEGKAKIPEFGEVGVGGAVAAKYQVGYGREESLSRSVTVGAEGKSNIQHTIRQYEIWETGNVLLVLGDKSEEIPYSFRRDFSIEALPPANVGCLSVKPTESTPAQPSSEEYPTTEPLQETSGVVVLAYGQLRYEENFNSDTDAWSLQGNSRIQAGELILEPNTGAGPATDEHYSNFIFEIETRPIDLAPKSELSIFLHFQDPQCPTNNCGIVFSVNMADKAFTVRRNTSDGSTRILNNIAIPDFNASEWNKFTIVVEGENFKVFVNDQYITEFTDATYQSGKFLLWAEGEGEERSAIAINYVRVYALP